VVVDGSVVSTLRAGEFFGEIAALEWGAGFARARSASVVARDDVRVRVVDPEALATLLAAAPRLEREIRLLAHDRLRRAR
jgi:CRP-like cAMP-binding protein